MLPIDQIKPGWTYGGKDTYIRTILRIDTRFIYYNGWRLSNGKYRCQIQTFRRWAVRVVDKGEGK